MRRFDVLVVGAGPAGSATAIAPRARRRAASCSPIAPGSRATSRAAAAITGRALRQAPCDISPVVERVVHTFELRLHRHRSFRRTSTEPLILMTQRRRLDAHLAEQAAAAGATFRDGVRVEQLEIGSAGVTAIVGGEPVSAGFIVGADGANGVVAKAAGLEAGLVRGVALEGNVAWRLLDRDRYASTAVIEVGAPSGGYGWLFPKAEHANLGVGGWAEEGPHLREHLTRLAQAYSVDPAAITDVRGHRLPMRRIGASTPASERVVLVGDAAGLVDPLSGDGMYEAFVSARLAAEAILAGDPAGTPTPSRRSSTRTRVRRGLPSARSTGIPPSASGRPVRPECSGSSAGLLRGEVRHPNEAKGLARPPLRLIARVARRT